MDIKKQYKTDIALLFNNKMVAFDPRGNLVVKVYQDGSGCLYNIGKKGYSDCHYCGLDKLKEHLQDLARIQGREELIPDDWTITEPEFFKAYGIIGEKYAI